MKTFEQPPTALNELDLSGDHLFTGQIRLGNGVVQVNKLAYNDIISMSVVNTWDEPGTTFEAFRLNMTDAQSFSDSLLMNLLCSNVSKFSVAKTGLVTAVNLSLARGTITSTDPALLTQTWNAAGQTFTAFKVNVTDSASAAASLLADFQVGGTSLMAIRKDGGLTSSSNFAFYTGTTLRGYFQSSNGLFVVSGNANVDGAAGLAFGQGSGYTLNLAGASASELELHSGTAGIANRKTLLAGVVKARAGTSASAVNLGGTLAVDTTQTGNVGAGVDTLQTYSVPANSLAANGDAVPFRYVGTFANNGNNKRLVLTYGATTIFDSGALAFPFTDWVIEGEIVRTGAATQKCLAQFTAGVGQATMVDYTTAAETLSGAVTLLLTGEATADNDVVKEIFRCKFEPAP